MAKKKKNKKKNKDEHLSVEEFAHMAQGYLEKSSFRKAKDIYKKLCKQDREKYLPKLVESYEGLMKQMLECGQIKEAKVIMEHILEHNPHANYDINAVLIDLKCQDYKEATTKITGLICSDNLPTDQSNMAADVLVLNFEIPDNLPLEISDELRLIYETLEAICNEDCEKSNLLRGISRKSIFKSWKLLIKGMFAFYAGEDHKSLESFRRLNGDSVPAKVAETYLALMDDDFNFPKDVNAKQSLQERICRITGSGTAYKTLSKVDSLWLRGLHIDAYNLMRRNFDSFPSGQLDLIGSLSRFFYQGVFSLNKQERDDYLDHLTQFHSDESVKNEFESLNITRLYLLQFSSDLTDKAICTRWDDFLVSYEKCYGHNQKLKLRVYRILGETFARKERPSFFMFFGESETTLRNKDLAFQYLERCIQLDPKDRIAYISLFHAYNDLNMKKEQYRLADRMIKAIPEDKDALLMAGIGCIERKSYFKGIGYLERARRLDPLDFKVKEYMSVGYLQISRDCFEKGKAEKGRDHFKKIHEIADPNCDHFNLNTNYIKLRLGLMECVYGNNNSGEQIIDEVLNTGMSALRANGFLLILTIYYKLPPSLNKKFKEIFIKELKQNVDAEDLLSFIKMLFFFEEANIEKFLSVIILLEKTVTKAVKNCPLNIGRELVKLGMIHMRGYLTYINDFFKMLASECIENALRKDPIEPFFAYYQILMVTYNEETMSDKVLYLEKLELILEEAKKRRENDLIKRVQKDIESVKEYEPIEEDDFVEEDEEEDFVDDDFPDMGELDEKIEELTRMLDGVVDMECIPEKEKKEVDHIIKLLGDFMPQDSINKLVKKYRSLRNPDGP